MKKNILLILALLFTLSNLGFAQEIPSEIAVPDSADSSLTKKMSRKERVRNRNFHYNILGGPGYTPDYGVVLGGGALMTFRMNPEDSTQLRSVVPASIAVMFKGGYNVSSRPQLFFKNDKFRIFGEVRYKSILDNYYGVGYSTNKHYERGEDSSEFRYHQFTLNPQFMFRLGESNFFIGPQFDLTYDKFKDPAQGIVEDPTYIKAGGTEKGYSALSSGLGFLMSYDTRDVPSNAYRGIFFDVKGLWYNKILGSDHNFFDVELEYRQYKSVGNRKVVAWTAKTENVFGSNIPLNKYILTGSPWDLRGYYMGQYRDKSSHVILAEYRQMINTDGSNRFKRLASHLGFAAWGGSGFMGPNPGKIEGVLPNVGAGLRIEIQPRMNIRFDVGRDFKNNSTLFYMNMTEAF